MNPTTGQLNLNIIGWPVSVTLGSAPRLTGRSYVELLARNQVSYNRGSTEDKGYLCCA
jgi:hypothetical protein